MNNKEARFLYLSQREVIECGGLDMAMVMDKVEEVLSLRDRGETSMPDKISLRWKDGDLNSRINAMPGYVAGDCNLAGIKWIGSMPDNPFKYDLPRASGLTILNDPDTAFPLCLMDGTLISAMRTGAVTGVGAKYLASQNSESAAFIGAGTQNHTQLAAVLQALPEIHDVRICDISHPRVDRFLEYEKALRPGISFTATDSAEEAVRGADVIVSATTTLKPIVKGEWVKKGAFISNVGNYEYEYDVVTRADRIYADNWQAVIHRKNQTAAKMYLEGLLTDEDLYSEMGEVINGKKDGRRDLSEILFFSPIGMGIEDIIVAGQIYRNAREKGLGTELLLWDEPSWV